MNDGVVELADFFELGDESTDGAVGVVDGAVVDGGLIVELTILRNDLVGGRNDSVGLVEPEVEEEGRVGVAFLVEPGNGFVNDELAGVTFHGPDGFAVAQKVGGIFVSGISPIDQAEPVVKAMFGGSGIVLATVGGHAEVPLAEVSGGVAFVFQDFGERRFAPKQMHSVTLFTKDGIDSGADVVAASEEGGTGRRADRRPGMEVGEAHALGGQLVEDRGLDWTTVTTNIAITKIVDEEGDDVWCSLLCQSGKGQRQETQKCKDVFHDQLLILMTITPIECGI